MRLGVREFRRRMADILRRVDRNGEVIIIERNGHPEAVLIPVDLYDAFERFREEQFQSLERLWSRRPDISDAEIERDVADALEQTRKAKMASRR